MFNLKRNLKEKFDKKSNFLQMKNEFEIKNETLNNDLKLLKLNTEYNQLETKKKIFDLKRVVKSDDLTIKSGKKLKLFAILVTIISTIITIAGGISNFDSNILSMVAFIASIVSLQFTVFLITSQETKIKNEYNKHYKKIITLKYLLLIVSIYSNFSFFKVNAVNFTSTVIILILCISIDLISIFLTSLAYDQIELYISKLYISKDEKFKKQSSIRNLIKDIIYKVIYNKIFKITYKINLQYNKNIDLLNDYKESNVIELNKNELFKKKELNNKTIKAYFEYIKNNLKTDNKIIGYKKLGELLNLKQGKSLRIYNKLLDKGYIEKDGRNTYLLKTDFNENDFEIGGNLDVK